MPAVVRGKAREGRPDGAAALPDSRLTGESTDKSAVVLSRPHSAVAAAATGSWAGVVEAVGPVWSGVRCLRWRLSARVAPAPAASLLQLGKNSFARLDYRCCNAGTGSHAL